MSESARTLSFAAVFTYGDKGYYVAGFVVGFAVLMHLVEVSPYPSADMIAAASICSCHGLIRDSLALNLWDFTDILVNWLLPCCYCAKQS